MQPKNGQVTPEQNSTTGTGVQNYGFSPLRWMTFWGWGRSEDSAQESLQQPMWTWQLNTLQVLLLL